MTGVSAPDSDQSRAFSSVTRSTRAWILRTVAAGPGRFRPGSLAVAVGERTSVPQQSSALEKPTLQMAIGPVATADHRWSRAFRAGLTIWIASRLGLTAASIISWVGEPNPGLTVKSVVRKWGTQWDSIWFLDIAKDGYRSIPDNSHAAFFPVYPGLIRLFTPVFLGNSWLAALFLANASLLAALVLLYRLTDQEFGKAAAARTVFYLVAFPAGFFLTAAYNEGLFIALIVSAVYCMRRGHWWLACVLGAVASGTRSAGIVLVVPFCFEYLRQHGRRIRWDALAIGVVPFGLAGVMIIGKIAYNNPFAFSDSQAARWGRHVSWPWTAVVDAVQFMNRDDSRFAPFGDVWTHNVLELGTVLLMLTMVALAFFGPWRVRRDQLVLPLVGLMLVIFMVSFPSVHARQISYPLLSTSRIGLEVFPAFMMMGRLGRYRWLDHAFLAVFLTMQGILVARFLHSGWVA
jgi:Gpi18-like mannosyltransferase